MGALLDHPPGVHHDDPIGEVQGREPVGDQQRRAAGQDGPQRVVDRLLGAGVDGAGGVVQDEDRRVGQDRPGQRDPLALAAGQRQPPLTDGGVVAARAAR